MIEDESNRRFDALYARWEGALGRQERRLQQTALLAPGLAVRLVSMALAGTDHAHHRHFATAAERYRRTMVGTMNQEFVRSLLAFGARPGDPTTWAKVADFVYQPPALAGCSPGPRGPSDPSWSGSSRHGRGPRGPGAGWSTSRPGTPR